MVELKARRFCQWCQFVFKADGVTCGCGSRSYMYLREVQALKRKAFIAHEFKKNEASKTLKLSVKKFVDDQKVAKLIRDIERLQLDNTMFTPAAKLFVKEEYAKLIIQKEKIRTQNQHLLAEYDVMHERLESINAVAEFQKTERERRKDTYLR